MNNFNVLDLSECHSEEVMFLLTLSVLESQFWVEAGGGGGLLTRNMTGY